MCRVFCVSFGQRLDLRQCVLSRSFDIAADRESPLFEIHFGVIHVVRVDVKLFQGGQFAIGECGRQMIAPKPFCGRPVGEIDTSRQQGVANLRNRESTHNQQGRKLQQLAAIQ